MNRRTPPPAQVTMLVPAQTRSAALALAASHADYPAFRHVFPRSDRRARALPPFFEATVRDGAGSGTVHGALAASGKVLGVAVWLPPGRFPWSVSRKLRAVPALLRVAAADPGAARSFARYGANAEWAHPAGCHWYLVVLGVRPECQGHGLGRMLLEPVLNRADEERSDCYLETSDRANIAWYKRFGFSVVADDLKLVPGGPVHVAMRRSPDRRRH